MEAVLRIGGGKLASFLRNVGLAWNRDGGSLVLSGIALDVRVTGYALDLYDA